MFYDLENVKSELICYDQSELFSYKATYTILVAVLCLAEFTPFLLPYSAKILHYLRNGDYEPKNFDEIGCLSRLFYICRLSIIGPFIFVLFKFWQLFYDFLIVLLCFTPKSMKTKYIKIIFDQWNKGLFDISLNELRNLEKQRKLAMLANRNLTFLVCQCLLFAKIVEFDNNENSQNTQEII